ncbi:unnamed protein product, partial [Mesorhabditis spiculigera]
YVKELAEDAPVDTVVVTVSATHAAGHPLYYSMAAPQDGRSQNIFTLDTHTGEIRLAKALDRETLDRHVLKVTAFERLDPSISSSASVVVEVLDVQDNSPQFERDSYFAEISEDAPIGTTIVSVFARDRDAGANGEVEYSLETEAEGSNLLSINPNSGVIQTAAALDRETLSLIRLYVIASDKGKEPLSSRALVELSINDVNDNAPVFSQDSYNITVLENVTVPVVIARLEATDADAGANGRVHYGMVTSSDLLHVDYKTGEVTLRRKIDARGGIRTFVVRAKDGAQPALSSTATLTLQVVDINDHPPRFIAAQKSVLVDEGVAEGEEVARVYAIDEDAGVNGKVSYSLEGSSDFRIDPDSGIIRANKTLDREETQRYELTVRAVDGGEPQLTAVTQMTILVRDINDNTPVFKPNEINVTLSEETQLGAQIAIVRAEDRDENSKLFYRIEHQDQNQPAGTLVGTLVATDPDEGSNADIEFRVFGGTDARLFELEADPQQKGVARLLSRQPFDYESKTNAFHLEVQASSGQLSSTVPVRVHVSDVNDHPPSLRPSILLVNRMTGGQGLERLGSLPAFDPDQNATLEYSLETNELLAVDRYSGKITLKGAWKRNIDAQVKACVSDGANTVCNPLRLLYTWVEDGWLGEAVTVSLRTTTVDDFLDPDVYARFRQSIASLSTWAEGSITVLSIMAKNSSTEVSFVVVDRTRLISGNRVSELIAGSLPRLSELSLLDIELASSDACLREPCPYYQKCRDTLKHLGAEFHQTDNFLAHSLKTLRTFTCECPRGFSSSPEMPESCNIRLDECFSGPYVIVNPAGWIRQGCVSTRGCQAGSCPENSMCRSFWDGHRCDCDPGYAGAACDPICSLEGICGPSGICVQTNSTIGYECHCANGRVGVNCESLGAVRTCPSAWWGRFGECRRCDCPSAKGFAAQCHPHTGQCLCPREWWESGGRCVRCECGLGATSLECDPENGQCSCAGEAAGRRCDRCPVETQVLDPKSLRCLSLRDRCPSQIDEAVQWPTTVRGATARQSCANGQIGLATRKCAETGKWQPVQDDNCTRAEFSNLLTRASSLSAAELVATVWNASQSDQAEEWKGRNLEMARIGIGRALDMETAGESDADGGPSAHLYDHQFVHRLVEAAGQLLPNESPQRFLELPRKLEKLGEALVRLHQRRKYLDPFAVQTPQIFFSVDRLDNRDSLPKFNNFVDDRVEGFPDIRITIADDSTLAFYQIIANPRCPRCSTAIVSVSANTTQPILVEFPLREDSGWKFPECVRHSAEENEQWTVRGAVLTGLNATHAVCLFHLPGLYTIHLRADSGVLVRLSLGQSMVGPISALSSLVILLMSLLLTLSRRGLRTRPVRVAFILSFAAHAATIYLLHKATVNAVFCGVRNAVLSFTTVSPYCWLFLYSLHLYRMLAEGNTQTSAAVCLLLGMALPCCLSVVSFLLSATCSLAPSHWLFWTIALPIALFLLLSFYACATCLLISRDKHFEVAVVKFALRKALCQHFLLTSLTVTYTAGGLFLPSMPWLSAGLGEMVSSILLLLTSLYILVWACAFGRSEDQTDRVETLWVKGEPPKSMADEHGCTSPLLHDEYAGSRMGSGGSAAGWASGSDRVPSDPYVPLPRPVGGLSLRDNPLAPSILSPANKIFRETSEYATTGSLSRFGKYEDEMDDAYYTYQRRKQYPTTFQR